MRLALGAFQFVDIEQYVDEQFGPDAVKVVLTTAMDEPFDDRSVTAILSKEAQVTLAHALGHDRHYDRARELLAAVLPILKVDGPDSGYVYEISRFLGVE